MNLKNNIIQFILMDTCATLFYNSGLDDILKNKDFYVKMLWIKYFMVIYFCHLSHCCNLELHT